MSAHCVFASYTSLKPFLKNFTKYIILLIPVVLYIPTTVSVQHGSYFNIIHCLLFCCLNKSIYVDFSENYFFLIVLKWVWDFFQIPIDFALFLLLMQHLCCVTLHTYILIEKVVGIIYLTYIYVDSDCRWQYCWGWRLHLTVHQKFFWKNLQ